MNYLQRKRCSILQFYEGGLFNFIIVLKRLIKAGLKLKGWTNFVMLFLAPF